MQFELSSIVDSLSTLLECCRGYRIAGQHKKAYHCFLTAMMNYHLLQKNANLSDQGVPNEYYSLLEEFTIFSYYVEQKKAGLLIADKLIFDYSATGLVNKNQIANNQRFYMEPLGTITDKKVQIKIKCEEHYNELNPSIVSVRGGYLLNCRTSNFGVKPGGIYYTKTSDGIVNTKNYILELDNTLAVKSQFEIVDLSMCDEYNSTHVKGLEDVIIFMHNDELWCTCTTLDTNPMGIPQISLCKLTFNNESKRYEIHTKRPMYLIEEGRPEKNWLPFSHGGQIKFIYSYSPIKIRVPVGELHEITKEVGFLHTEEILRNDVMLDIGRFRGSGGPVMLETKDGLNWLIIVHEVSWCPDKSRIYTHRFVLMNEKFEIIKISNPWFFEAHGIEFCRSMCLKGGMLVITCGLKDEEAWCYIIDKKKVLELLKDLDEFKLDF